MATALSSIYLFFTGREAKDYINQNYKRYGSDLDTTLEVLWNINTIFTVAIIAMSLSLML